MMEPLNLPAFSPRLRKNSGGDPEVFDEIRRKFVRLTPEEWVRQHFINFMITVLGYPASLMVVEAVLTYNTMKKRFDILVYNTSGNPRVIIECKAPNIKLTQAVFDQVAMYNMTLKVDYLIVTNGIAHFACHVNHETRTYSFLKTLPAFKELL